MRTLVHWASTRRAKVLNRNDFRSKEPHYQIGLSYEKRSLKLKRKRQISTALYVFVTAMLHISEVSRHNHVWGNSFGYY